MICDEIKQKIIEISKELGFENINVILNGEINDAGFDKDKIEELRWLKDEYGRNCLNVGKDKIEEEDDDDIYDDEYEYDSYDSYNERDNNEVIDNDEVEDNGDEKGFFASFIELIFGNSDDEENDNRNIDFGTGDSYDYDSSDYDSSDYDSSSYDD